MVKPQTSYDIHEWRIISLDKVQFWQREKHRLNFLMQQARWQSLHALSIPHFSFKEFINENSSLNPKVHLNASFFCKTYFLFYLLLQVTQDLAPLPLQYDLDLFKASLSLGKEPRRKVKEAFPWQHHLDMFSRHGRDVKKKCGVCSEKQHLGTVLMKTHKTV